jgi:hypothetical protein
MDTNNTAYSHWRRHAESLLLPLENLMSADGGKLDLRGPPSDHDENADRLEAVARPCLLAALWWQSLDLGTPPETRARAERQAAWFRAALVRGTRPGDAAAWGPNANFHQNGVEMGLFVIALEVAKAWLWEPLSDDEQEQVARWMASNRGTGHHWNNHFFFGIFALEFLESAGRGRAADRASIRHWFDEMEWMYRGQGWFMDGMNQTYDHYNAYAFHFYAPLWIHLYGARDPARVERWRGWTREFLASYEHFFAPSGEHPAFGRSITYRFNASATFAAGHLVGASPLPPGRARRLCTRNLEFFLNAPIRQEQGALGLGWTDVFPAVAEPYSCAGSVYWCAKVFAALLIDREDPFWAAPEEPLKSEGPDYVHVIPVAGLTVRKIGEAVELVNAGTSICASNRDKFGPFKWGKVAYRTGFAFTLGDRDHYSRDLGLTATDRRDGRTFGRHYTVPLAMDEAYSLFSYNLGDRELQCNVAVESLVAWKGPWILQVHQAVACQDTDLALGGYSLPMNVPGAVVAEGSESWLSVGGEGRTVALQRVGQAGTLDREERAEEQTPRRHLMAPFHFTPLLVAPVAAGETRILAALCHAGSEGESGKGAAPWTLLSLAAGRWKLHHHSLGEWELSVAWLPGLDL